MNTDVIHSLPKKKYLPMVLALSLGLILSFTGFRMVHSRVQEIQRLEFEARAKVISDSMQKRFDDYVGVLHFLGDFIDNSTDVRRLKFSKFVKGAIERYPAIQGLSWAPVIMETERAAFEARVRGEGIPDFSIRDIGEHGVHVPSAIRASYVVAYYVEPLNENREAMGLDLASEPIRKQAFIEAYRTGQPAATRRLSLIQERGDQYGILLSHPIFRDDIPDAKADENFGNLRGFVIEALRIGDVVERVLKLFPEGWLDISLFDRSVPGDDQILYFRPAPSRRKPLDDMSRHTLFSHPAFAQSLNVAGRTWEIRFTPSPEYLQAHRRYRSYIMLVGSVMITLLLTFYMYKRVMYTTKIERAIQAEIRSKRMLENEIQIRVQETLKLIEAKRKLEAEIEERIKVEKQRDKSIAELTHALAEVKTLRGILPLCSFCKKIRDDKGYWEQVDVYIHKHSQADISHSICPQCMKDHYPEEYQALLEKNQISSD